MSKKNIHDQYYTKDDIAIECIGIFIKIIPEHNRIMVIEPSAGEGAFYKNYVGVKRGIDIDPKCPEIEKGNFLDYTLLDFVNSQEETAILGNPPFGFSCSLAIKFFNHASLLANVIAFIVPKTFKKASIHKKLATNFHIIHEHDLPKNSFLLDGKEYDVPCCFQIWKKAEHYRSQKVIENEFLEFVKKKDATDKTFCVRRAGGKAGQRLDGLDHKEVSTYFVNESQPGVKAAIDKLDLSIVGCTAGVKSISKPELLAGIKDKLNDIEI